MCLFVDLFWSLSVFFGYLTSKVVVSLIFFGF